ncbi:MAG: DNA methylase [Lachnospiraceae bacterium]|nr:DNA methylase [Lachnospiraceae bacterium]
MADEVRYYIAIDLKSFYASVECVDMGLDPLKANLVVADVSRTEKTICLAVSPALKAYGIPGRARLFEVVSAVKKLKLDYIAAPPRMSRYIEVSTQIYKIYLKYVAPEDIHVYSIDEVFMDVTSYLKTYGLTPHELAVKMIRDVLSETGITATAGIGTNMYLCKVAMDIVAKHVEADEDGVRVAFLDETSYRRLLWDHRPLTDFWRIGHGIAKKLEAHGMYTMGDVARCSLGGLNDFHNEDLLYKLFGVNAELIIDHAWGCEPCLISDIKAYKPESSSIGSGQVLKEPYPFDKGRLIVWEMTDLLVLDLVDKGLMTDQIVLTIGYDIKNLEDPGRASSYKGEVSVDRYGRSVPKHAHGSINLERYTSSSREILDAVVKLYDEIVDPSLLIRRVTVTANRVVDERSAIESREYEQLSLFDDHEALVKEEEEEHIREEKEKNLQHAVIDIKKKFGKNAILKGTNFVEGAMTRERNSQIGGHRS